MSKDIANAHAHDRIQLPMSFDVARLQRDVTALSLKDYVYYDALPLRSPAHMVDPSLPHPPPADDYADGTWTPWLNAKSLDNCPYITEIIEFFQKHTQVNLVRVLRLAANSEVEEHTDPTLGLHIERSMVRLTIPISDSDDVIFYLNNTPMQMAPGECWYMRLTDPHRVVNNSHEDRINLTIDVIPNAWLRMLLEEQCIAVESV